MQAYSSVIPHKHNQRTYIARLSPVRKHNRGNITRNN